MPRNPVQLEQELREVANQIAEQVRPRARAFNEWKKTAREYKLARAHAFMKAEGTVKDRDAQADLETAEQWEAMDIAEAAFKYADWLAQSYRDKLSALQSEQKSVTAMFAPMSRG